MMQLAIEAMTWRSTIRDRINEGPYNARLIYDTFYLRPARPVPVGPPETGLEEPRPGDAAAS